MSAAIHSAGRTRISGHGLAILVPHQSAHHLDIAFAADRDDRAGQRLGSRRPYPQPVLDCPLPRRDVLDGLEIAGRGRADAGSLAEALKLARRLAPAA